MVMLPLPGKGPSRPGVPHRFGLLSPPRQRLVREMQRIWYGRIRNLPVRDGEPVFTRATIIEVVHKFGVTDDAERPQTVAFDFVLKERVVEFYAKLDRLGDCIIVKLEIHGGLPLEMTVRW